MGAKGTTAPDDDAGEVMTPDVEPRRSGGKRTILLAVGGVLLVVIVVALAAFQPWKLFQDKRVDEELPVATGGPAASGSTPSSGAPAGANQPVSGTSLSGQWMSREHGTSGQVTVISVDGTQYLRLDELDTSNGPDLFVYLSAAPGDASGGAFDDDFVNLGPLKGNKGNQNYEIPAGTDLSKYRTAVIWCDRFDAVFGTANLS
jgi:hypothetical protein